MNRMAFLQSSKVDLNYVIILPSVVKVKESKNMENKSHTRTKTIKPGHNFDMKNHFHLLAFENKE